MTPISCMGGWCSLRQECARHLTPTERVAERLCPAWNHVEFVRPRADEKSRTVALVEVSK